MKGRRLPLDETGHIPDGPWEEGDYCGPTSIYTGCPTVFFRPPTMPEEWTPLHVCSPPHTLRECPDGSLEIRPSILARRHLDWTWHGFLDEGHEWRTA